MKFKKKFIFVCSILIILLLMVEECVAAKKTSSRKTTTNRGSSGSGSNSNNNNNNNSGGSWWSRVTGGGSSSSSSASKVQSSAPNTNNKVPQPSAPQHEPSKTIGWNVPGSNNPGAPPAYSNTHTRGLSNPSGLANPPPYSKNSPPGHQTMQANVPNQYQGLNYPRNPGQTGYPGGSYSNQAGHYPGLNQGVSGHSGYPGSPGGYPGYSGGYQGYSGGYPAYSGGYAGHSGYSPAAPGGYFASGYPTVNNYYGQGQRSSSGSTLTNALLAGSVGLGLYNAIRPYPSYSGGYSGGVGGGSTVHHHYYNNQAVGANNANPNPAQAIPANQNTNAIQPAVAPIPQGPIVQNSTAALVTPPPPTLAPDSQISDLDCVYAMKILNCTEIPNCPQEWLHPSCLNRTISKEYYDSITLPPPPPMPQFEPLQNDTASEKRLIPGDQMIKGQNQNVYSASGQNQPVVPSSTVVVNNSLYFTVFLTVTALMLDLRV